MPRRRTIKRHLLATAVMFIGTLSVASFVMAMNSHVRPPEKPAGDSGTSFVVEKVQKKKERPRRKQRKQRKSQQKAPPVGCPDLGASLGLAGLPMPDIDASALMDSAGGRPDPSSVVMTEDAVDTLPRPTRQTAPQYPERARRMGIEGHVTARLLIDSEGRIKRVRLVEASPEDVFDEVALNALNRWSFEPATYQGQAVHVWARQTIEFALD